MIKINVKDKDDRHQIAMALVFVRSFPEWRSIPRVKQLTIAATRMRRWASEAYDANMLDHSIQQGRCADAIMEAIHLGTGKLSWQQ